jgi:hypothetical protein
MFNIDLILVSGEEAKCGGQRTAKHKGYFY